MSKLTITEISRKIAKGKSNVNAAEVSSIITQFVDEIRNSVYNGNEVKIKGLATFKIEIAEEQKKFLFTKNEVDIIPRRFKLKTVVSQNFIKKINDKPIG